MTGQVLLVFSERGYERAYKKTDGVLLNPGEVAFVARVSIPNEAFRAAPVPVIELSIAKEQLRRELAGTLVFDALPESSAGG